jgi:peptidoglycan/LPS O-acetylase OafA/YrhL
LQKKTDPFRTSLRLDIQGLRGLAVLLVILYHAKVTLPIISGFSGGFVGVDVFFVISGFVVGGLLIREYEANGQINVQQFFARRARRLLPALSIVTSVSVLAAVFLVQIEALSVTSLTGAAVSLFASNVSLYCTTDYFSPDVVLNPLLHTWSLSVEAQFYLAFPFLFVFSSLLGDRFGLEKKKPFLGFLIAGCFVSFALSHYLLVTEKSVLGLSATGLLSFYSPFTRAWEFGAGVLLVVYVSKTGKRDWIQRYSHLLGILGLSLILYAAVSFTKTTPFPGFPALLPVLGSVLIILAGTSSGSLISRGLAGPCLSTIGNWSYSWYLWHWPCIVFTSFLWPERPEFLGVAAFMAIVPSWLSFRFVEQHFRTRKSIETKRTSALVVASICIPIIISLCVMGLEKKAFSNLKNAESFIATIRENTKAAKKSSPNWPDLDQPLDIVLVGDSHAMALSLGMFDLAAEYGIRFSRITQAGCYLLNGPYTGTRGQKCSDWQEATLDLLLSAEVDTVVMTGYLTGRITGFKRGQGRPIELFYPDGSPVENTHDALKLYEEGLYTVVDLLTAAGKTVIIVTSVPDFSRGLFTTAPGGASSAWDALTGNHPTILTAKLEKINLEDAQARNAPLWEIESRVVDKFDTAYALDLAPFICINGVCQQYENGVLLYWDTDHLAYEGAKRAAKPLLDFWTYTLKKKGSLNIAK